MNILEWLKVAILGIVEGITEWLPISSTGHMILVDEFIHLNVSEDFMNMFLVVIQLGAILAVVVLYFKRLWPFHYRKEAPSVVTRFVNVRRIILWLKILVACIPAIILGLLFDDFLEEHFYNYVVVACMLILYGILFIVIENYNRGRKPKITKLRDISFRTAFCIGLFQVLSLIPGTSRSGSTIIGGILMGTSRSIAAEFTFFLAIPVMFGASLLKIVEFGFHFTSTELAILLVGMLIAFLVSILAIRFLMNYIKKHDFKVFGWYRIILGVVVLGYFAVKSFVL